MKRFITITGRNENEKFIVNVNAILLASDHVILIDGRKDVLLCAESLTEICERIEEATKENLDTMPVHNCNATDANVSEA